MMRYYDFSEPRRTRRRVKRKNIKVLGFMLLAFVLLPFIIGVYLYNRDQFSPAGQTLAVTTAAPQIPSATSIPKPTAQSQSVALEQIVQEELAGTKGKYSVVVKHLKTGETYVYKEHQQYQSGSLYKLWVMAVAYNQIREGKLKESDVLKSDVATINQRFRIATEAAELKEGEVSFPVNQALQQMITISHNYAALLLAQRVKLSNVTQFLQTHQLSESRVGQPPITTAYDIANFMEALYKGQLADSTTTATMIDLLKKQRLNNKLPKLLPTGTVVAHKTGELGQVTHDAGIVYTDQGDYIIVILSESSLPSTAEDRIANISKGVYEHFRK